MHRIVETFKHAFVDRMKLGDPEYVPDTDKIISRIVSDSRIAEILSKIKDVGKGWRLHVFNIITNQFLGGNFSTGILFGRGGARID